jgi:hypothetical protein
MSEGSLFNSGFLGASFSWWIGQIADDSTWRDNILPGKFESANEVPGWGRRYKVRIIGLHDQGEKVISSDRLPWAQVMYPVTGGGGQAKAGGTANLRQGNMVFGFFLDGQDQQVPVIMGVLGNNAQTSLATQIGSDTVTNTQPGSLATSGYAESAIGTKDPNIRVPDEGLVIKKPAPPGTPSVGGIDSSRPLTSVQLNAAQSARAEADRLGETGALREARIANATTAAARQEADAAASPSARAVPGATIENVDAVHLQSNADTKRLDLYLKKTVMLSPCDLPGSAMKAMQTDIDNLTKEVDKILQSAQFYVDAVSQIGGIGTPEEQIQKLIEKFVPKIAKYMKIVFNKILEFVTKQINKVLGPLADAMYPNQRFQFFDIKIEISEEIKCLFTKIMENLPRQIKGNLTTLLLGIKVGSNISYAKPQSIASESPGSPPTPANPNPRREDDPGTTPFVPICFVEDLTGRLIKKNMKSMNNTVNKIVGSVSAFLKDVREENVEAIEQLIDQAQPTDEDEDEDEENEFENLRDSLLGIIEGLPGLPQLPGGVLEIATNIAAAFSFENISMDLFGCDLKPNCPISDFYTLQEGAGAAEDAQLPRPAEVSKRVLENPGPGIVPAPIIRFAAPERGTPNLPPPPPGAPPDGGYKKNQFFPPSLYDNSITDALDIF